LEDTIPIVVTDKKQNYSAMNDEGQLRADTYLILASLLSNTPTQDLIDYLSHIEALNGENAGADEIGSMGQAWQQLRTAAIKSKPGSLDDEYHYLFIGLGRGAAVPYGSWHITGFLMDKPLSDLRDDLKSLGIESDDEQKDPEDHIAALCETMALIIGAKDINETRERQFFLRHIHPWADKFFKEIQSAKSADFYKSVGFLGQQFFELENQYLNIQTH
jgi:TorA maturation chaperone TorD